MSAAVLDAVAPAPWKTVAEVVRHFGDVPADRIRLTPAPGTATEADLAAAERAGGPPCELVDGTLVDKSMGTPESRLGNKLVQYLENYLDENDVGFTTGADGGLKLGVSLIRKPDVGVILWAQFPSGEVPPGQYPAVAPDIAVEITSPSNYPGEMRRKRADYFAAGTQEVWEVDLSPIQIRVYTGVDEYRTLAETDILEGGKLLPGFRVDIGHWFRRAFRSKSR